MTTGTRSLLWLGRPDTAPSGPVDPDTTYGSDGYSYSGAGEVDTVPPVAATPANRHRETVRTVHESLPAPTLTDGRPT